MKDLLAKLFGTSTSLVERAEGEASDALDTLKRTGGYVKRWALLSMLLLTVGMGLCWFGASDGVVRGMMVASLLFSGVMLAGIIWNAAVVAGMVALASSAGDEIFGANFPNVEPKTVISVARKAVGWVAWVAFAHLVALLLPVDAWRDPGAAITVLAAVGVLFAGAVAGWFGGRLGRVIMLTTATAVVLLFVGKTIPGVREYGAALTAEHTRKLTLLAAEKDLGSIPEDLLSRKVAQLAELKKKAIDTCGQLACDEVDIEEAASLEREIADLGGNLSTPGEVDDESSDEVATTSASYGEHALPPAP